MVMNFFEQVIILQYGVAVGKHHPELYKDEGKGDMKKEKKLSRRKK